MFLPNEVSATLTLQGRRGGPPRGHIGVWGREGIILAHRAWHALRVQTSFFSISNSTMPNLSSPNTHRAER